MDLDTETSRLRSWVAAILVSAALCSAPAAAQDDGAGQILKAMSDYLAGQQAISLTFDSDVEVMTENFQKIQFTSSGQVQVSRPNMVRATRTGGYSDIELTSTKTVTVSARTPPRTRRPTRPVRWTAWSRSSGRILDRDPERTRFMPIPSAL